MFKTLLFCAVVTYVSCQTNKPTLDQIENEVFADIDKNGDHKIEKSEFDDYLKNNDPTGDNSMDFKEFSSVLKRTAPKDAHTIFDLYDKNHDKVLDLKDTHLAFQAFDVNGDGQITMHEFKEKYVGVLLPPSTGSIVG